MSEPEVTVQSLCDRNRPSNLSQFIGNTYVAKYIYQPMHAKLKVGQGIVLRGPRGIGKHTLVELCGTSDKAVIDVTSTADITRLGYMFEYPAPLIFILDGALPSVEHWLITHPSLEVVSMDKLSMDDIVNIGSKLAVSLSERSATAASRICVQMVANLAEMADGNARKFASLLYDAAVAAPENWAARIYETRGCIEHLSELEDAMMDSIKQKKALSTPLPSARYATSLIVNSLLYCPHKLSHSLVLMKGIENEHDDRHIELLHREFPKAVDVGCNPDRIGEMLRVAESFSYADIMAGTDPTLANAAVALSLMNRSPRKDGLKVRVNFAIERDIGTRHKYWAHATHESRRRIPLSMSYKKPHWEVQETVRAIVSRFTYNLFGIQPKIEQMEQYRSMCEAFVATDEPYRDDVDKKLFYMDYVRSISEARAIDSGFVPVVDYNLPPHRDNIATLMFLSARDPMERTAQPIVTLRDIYLLDLQTRITGRHIDHTLTARWVLLLELLRPHQKRLTALSRLKPAFPRAPFAMLSLRQILIDDAYRKSVAPIDANVLPDAVMDMVPSESELADAIAAKMQQKGVIFVQRSKWVAMYYHIFSRVVDMDTLRLCYTQYVLYKFLNDIMLIGY